MKNFDMASIDKFKLSRFNDIDKDAHIIYENIDKIISEATNEISFSKKDLQQGNIDLSSFKPKKELNKDLFPNEYMNSKIRLKLLDIADDFIDTLGVDWTKPKDIILTGSLANYNWSKYSDFDLHILIDFKKVDDRTNFVKDYFDSKKNLWNNEHEDLFLLGFPVEVYVQDINEPHTSSGVYSLMKNKWVRKPEKDEIKAIKMDKFMIKEKTSKFIKRIRKYFDIIEKEKDKHKIEKAGDDLNGLFDKIKAMRKEGLDKSGEMNPFNIIYKLLRRMGYIDKILDMKTKVYDKINSIK